MRTSFFLCLLAFPSLTVVHRAIADDDHPNLVIIHTDEHNFRTLGCYRDTLPKEQALMWGDAVVETPHIDWIAENGALCTSFYATTPVCSPSRAAFITGRYPHNTPVNTNNIPLSDDMTTFAEILHSQKYATGYVGKWHLDGGGKPQWEPERKFGFYDNRYMFNRGHWKQLELTPEGPRVKARSENGAPSYGATGADEQSFTTDFLTDRTIEFIQQQQDHPFCVMLSLPDPHGPDSVRPPYDTMYADQTYQPPRSADKPDEGLPTWGQKQGGGFDQAKYYGMVKCIDDNVGKILAVLRKGELLDNTIVVFTSDHGDLRGEHHRHNKGVPYEASAKIPFVIYYKGEIQPGTIVNEALSCVDFLPTILSLMGAECPVRVSGRDASKLLQNGAAPDAWYDIAFLRSTGVEAGWLAAVTDRYKLVLSTADDPWLFDLETDPDELTNALTDPAYRETIRELAKQLAEYGMKYKDPRAANPLVQADLQWAIGDSETYASPRSKQSIPKQTPQKKRKQRKPDAA